MTIESRMSAVEIEQARQLEQLRALTATTQALAALPTQYAILHLSQTTLAEDVSEIKTMLGDRDAQASRDRKELRVALIGLAGIIIAALIAAFATLAGTGALG